MAKEEKNTLSKKEKNMVVAMMAAAGLAPSFLVPETATAPLLEGFMYYALALVAIIGGGTYLTKKYGGNELAEISERKNHLNAMTSQFNKSVALLEQDYKEEKSLSFMNSSTRQLKKKYSREYEKLYEQFVRDKQQYLTDRNQQATGFQTMRQLWGWIMAITLCGAFTTCVGSIPVDNSQTAVSALSESAEPVYWNAQNIPIPYLQDSTQYVSNPDHVLTQEAVDRINITMSKIEHEFDVQSVVIVVNHIENDDPYRMAQDVGNSYGVGRRDRGLVVVVGYEDHSINMSPGRELEADLTDAECRQLQQLYVIPGMKAEMPDSAMIYLADAIYSTLQKKELPQMSSLFDADDDDSFAAGFGLYACFLLAWIIFFVYKNKKYQWVSAASAAALVGNPFYEASSGGGIFVGGGGGFRGGGGGGGFSGGGGGSFGGGSFGGGGATSRW